MSKTENVFAHELSLIQNKDIQAFVLRVFDSLAPDYFWTAPASTSGKYHPAVSLGAGGIVRHTKLAVWWARELANIEEPAVGCVGFMDEVIAALLLHDLKKNGDALDAFGKPTLDNATAVHGVYLGTQIEMWMFPPGVLPTASERRIIHAVKTHMGRWPASGCGQPDTYMDILVHLADYCASRRVDGQMTDLMQLWSTGV